MASCIQKIDHIITATFTAEPIKNSLEFWMSKFGFNISLKFENQIFKQLLDPTSPVRNNNGINTILIRFDDWLKVEDGFETDFNMDSLAQVKIEKNIEDFLNALKTVLEYNSATYIVVICPPALNVESDINYQEIEQMLSERLQGINGIHSITSSEIFDLYPVENYYDHHADKMGLIPFRQIFYDCLGTVIARKIVSIKGLPYKVIALDCDQTLWKGVCSEDGVDGIEVDSSRRQLQEFVLKQSEAGMLLCLCSKNNEKDVMDVFKDSNEMLIKKDHIVAHRINWEDKSVNLKSLAEELQLGLDSFIFIDDNPVECMEVKAHCPQVLTLCLPENDEAIPLFLESNWAFDRVKTTAVDQKRTELYKQNIQRNAFKEKTMSYQDFLNGLELKVVISELKNDEIARVAQLTQRVNQFNFTTIRRTETDLKKLSKEPKVTLYTVKASDRFGDYGLVGLLIGCVQESELKIDSFLLSCRALGKGLEYQMLAQLGELAEEKGLSVVEAVLIPNSKNMPAQQFLSQIGAEYLRDYPTHQSYYFPVEFLRKLAFEDYLQDENSNNQDSNVVVAEVGNSFNWSIVDVFEDIVKNFDTPAKIHANINSPKQDKVSNRAEYIGPRNEIEVKIVKIWEEVLDLEQIGIEDNFFDLGGESIKAIQILSRIREEFEVDIPMSVLFEGALTVAGLAAAVEESLLSGLDEDLIAEELKAIEDLSDEEIEELLKAENQ